MTYLGSLGSLNLGFLPRLITVVPVTFSVTVGVTALVSPVITSEDALVVFSSVVVLYAPTTVVVGLALDVVTTKCTL